MSLPHPRGSPNRPRFPSEWRWVCQGTFPHTAPSDARLIYRIGVVAGVLDQRRESPPSVASGPSTAPLSLVMIGSVLVLAGLFVPYGRFHDSSLGKVVDFGDFRLAGWRGLP